MIVKNFELNKINLEKYNLFLFYGENEGHKNEVINNIFNKLNNYKKIKYDENDIFENYQNFISEIFNKSLFDEKKLIIIDRTSEKILNLIKEISTKKIFDSKIIIISSVLQKKSKLRILFETENKLICVPFYTENNITLLSIANKFFKSKNIQISQETINLISERAAGDRINLHNELSKIEAFAKHKKKINYEDILKLTNLADDYSISEIIDNCLSKNIKKIITILNENNFSAEDCIIILRTLLFKSKRLLKLMDNIQETNDIDKSISLFKPPIFWKEKEIVKNQINKWNRQDVIKLIKEIYEIEILVKRNSTSSLNIVCDFIVNKSKAA
tara:strand:+ start:343 stop:1332 length:990 start_codon:yes stop_codon:yes gene_type:complete